MAKVNSLNNDSSTFVVDNTLTVTTGNAVVTAGDIWANNIQRMDMTGFYSWAASGPYFDDTTLGTFDLLVGGTGYIKGKVVTWAAQSITGLTAGSTWYIYIDNTGTIGKTSSRTDALFVDNIVLFECWRDSTSPTNVQHTVKENHPYDYETTVSNWTHNTAGTVIQNGGANISLVGTTGIGIAGTDILNDHGLATSIPDSVGAAVTWKKVYLNASGKWAVQNTSNVFGGYWNNAGTPTALTGTRVAVYRLYASKDNLNTTTPVYFAVLDITDYSGQTSANTAIANGTPQQANGELAQLELVQLGYITFRSGAITSVVVNKTTFRSGTTTGSGTNNASLVLTNTTNFNGILSGSDTNVQAALDTIDNWGATTTNHAVLLGAGTGSPIASMSVGTAGEVLIGGTASTDPKWLAGGTTGQVLTAVTSADPHWAAVSAPGLTINNQTASYTLLITDAGSMVIITNAADNTLTVPLNSSVAFPIGTTIQVQQGGAGQTTVVATGGVTINSDQNALSLNNKNSTATLTKTDTDTWSLTGDVVARWNWDVSAQSSILGSGGFNSVVYDGSTNWLAVSSSGGFILSATDPSGTWSPVAIPTTSAFNAIAYGAGYWVVGGASGTLFVASDPHGIWTQVTSSFSSNAINGINYDGSTYWTIVGANGQLATATNPLGTWTNRTSGFSTTAINAVTYGASTYCTVGDSGKLYYTSDPTSTWNAGTSGFSTTNIRTVKYDGSTNWVIGGATGKLATASSPSGTWTVNANANFGTNQINSVAYDGSTHWVAVGAAGVLTYATDPTATWTAGTSSIGASSLNSVTYGNSKWCAVGGSSPRITTASDPTTTWVQNYPYFSSTYSAGAYGNGYFVVGGSGGVMNIASNPNGTWVVKDAGFGANSINSVVYDGSSQWVAAGNAGTMTYTSSNDPNGTWTAATSGFGASNINGLAYDGSTYWCAVGQAGKLATASSPSGTWTLNTSTSFNILEIKGIAYGNGKWVAWANNSSGFGLIATAADPTGAWVPNPLIFNTIFSIAYGNGMWTAVAGGSNTLIATATDPAGAWTMKNVNCDTGSLVTLNFANGTWIAGLSSSRKLLISTNPAQFWTQYAYTPTAYTPTRAIYGNGKWMLLTTTAALITSTGA